MSAEFEARLESRDHLTRLLCRFITAMGGKTSLQTCKDYLESLGLEVELVLPRLGDMGFDVDERFVKIRDLVI
jgi:hypothetical protein